MCINNVYCLGSLVCRICAASSWRRHKFDAHCRVVVMELGYLLTHVI
jgi:hypothetical protein